MRSRLRPLCLCPAAGCTAGPAGLAGRARRAVVAAQQQVEPFARLGGDEVGGYSVAGGLTGLALAFLIAWLANRAISRKVGPPSVQRLTPESR